MANCPLGTGRKLVQGGSVQDCCQRRVAQQWSERASHVQLQIDTDGRALCQLGKVKGIRFETLARICEVLDCQPGDLLEAEPGL